jgi:hypothetical protein
VVGIIYPPYAAFFIDNLYFPERLKLSAEGTLPFGDTEFYEHPRTREIIIFAKKPQSGGL